MSRSETIMSRTDFRADSFGADSFGADSFRDDMTIDELAHAMLGQLQAQTVAPDRTVNGRSPTRTPGAPDVRNSLSPVGIDPGLDPYTAFRSTATQPAGSDYYFLEFARAAAAATQGSGPFFDVDAVRRDFPILHKSVDGKPLVWLDNGATTQKPQVVIDTVRHFYENDNSNVHRAAHQLAARATELYEEARKTVQLFIGAGSPDEIIFTKGTTESINLAANSLGALLLKPGDEILLSTLEHHANIVPWQMIAARTGAKITTIPIDETGQVMLDEYYKLLSRRTKIVAISHVSNVLGTVLPVEMMTGPAHAAGAKVLVDGAQSIAHAPVNVTSMDADLFVFSGHKIYGPTGVGVLYGKRGLLEQLPPCPGRGADPPGARRPPAAPRRRQLVHGRTVLRLVPHTVREQIHVPSTRVAHD